MALLRIYAHALGTSLSVRLEGESNRHGRHGNIQRSAEVDWHGRRGIRHRRDHRAENTHDTVAGDGDTVAGRTMGRRQDFRGVGIERSVVDVEAEADEARKGYVLRLGADLGVREEEGHLRRGMSAKIVG